MNSVDQAMMLMMSSNSNDEDDDYGYTDKTMMLLITKILFNRR